MNYTPQPEILLPHLPDGPAPRAVLGRNKKQNGTLYLAGIGKQPAPVMFVSTSVDEEDVREESKTFIAGYSQKMPAKIMSSLSSHILKDVAEGVGLFLDQDYFYTSLCRWLLPKGNRGKPKRDQIEHGLPALEADIRLVQPKIIVCLGKPVFDTLQDRKYKLNDILGGWFWSERYNCRLFVMPDQYHLANKPDYVEKFRYDLAEVKRMTDSVLGVEVESVPLNYQTIENTDQLRNMVQDWRTGNYTLFSVDCEWGGNNHVDGELRSIQFCWKPGNATYVRFMDDKGNYVFDSSYKEAGKILGEWLNRPECKYMGHHYAADAPWMLEWLGLDVFEKCKFDTEFAQQCANEHEDLKLERLSLKYTDLGRYDIPLLLWKKDPKNKEFMKEEYGYKYIPDEVLIPYACRDVDVVMRAYPKILSDLLRQNLVSYYFEIFQPFVTDVFTNFALVGLPMDVQLMDDLRDVYSFARDRLQITLRRKVCEEAEGHMLQMLGKLGDHALGQYKTITDQIKEGEHDKAWSTLKQCIRNPSHTQTVRDVFDHYVIAPDFNIRSKDHMRRWLFKVKGYEPVKSTNQKEKGLPSMSWDKVKSLPPNRRDQYQPSTDRQTIEMLKDKHDDTCLKLLLELNSVGNLVKAFLKEPQLDEETGEVTKENGLHFWLCSDNRVHGQFSTTETGRPRSWKPNSLNWPKYVNKMITSAIRRVIQETDEKDLPETVKRYKNLDDHEFPSVRSCVAVQQIPPLPGSKGWVMVESDLDTAEVVGLAFISDDEKMISSAIDPDPQFAVTKDEHVVRLKYADDCGIDPRHQHPSFLLRKIEKHSWHELGENDEATARAKIRQMAEESNGSIVESYDGYVKVTPVDVNQLKRNKDGLIYHPRHDLHWEMSEAITGKAREVISKDLHRDGLGKVANFQIPYGSSESGLERQVEAVTGVKPEEGIGEKMKQAYGYRNPKAAEFLTNQEYLVYDPGYYRSISGRIRHANIHKRSNMISGEMIRRMSNAQQREFRNFPMQNNVADTMAKAATLLLQEFRARGMHARPIAVLYDAMLTLCPIEEMEAVAQLHHECIHVRTYWPVHGRNLRYTIDSEYVTRWSTKLNPEEKKIYGKPPKFKELDRA